MPRGCLQPGRSGAGAGSRHKLWKLRFICLFYVFIYLEMDSHTFYFLGGLAEFEFVCFGESVLIFFFADVMGQAVKKSSNEALSLNY